jgi:hypothetical protein
MIFETHVPSSFYHNVAQFLHRVIGLKKTRAWIYRRAQGHENCALREDKTGTLWAEDTVFFWADFHRAARRRLNVCRAHVNSKKTCDSILCVSWRVGRSAQWLFNTVDVKFCLQNAPASDLARAGTRLRNIAIDKRALITFSCRAQTARIRGATHYTAS